MSRDSGAHKFDKFLKDNGISIRRAAEGLRVSDPTILDWRNDRKTPSPEHRVAIRVWTKGAIAEGDWQTKREREQAKNAALVKPFERTEAPPDEPTPDSGHQGSHPPSTGTGGE